MDPRIEKRLNAEMEEGESPVITLAAKELTEYFTRQRTTFDVPLLLAGTDFQTRVWNQLLTIPYGRTLSYGELALQMGCPKAVRAVANANGANVLSLFIPCHRVVGSDGSLTGYAGGLEAKKLLLALESR
jgi:methylated-DNA-[protein]-cysteine S-methyltransferase